MHYIPYTKGQPKETIYKHFWRSVNVEYVTAQIKAYILDKYGHDYLMAKCHEGVNSKRIYWIVNGKKDASCLTWKEFNSLLDKLGYKVQFRIVSK